MVEEHLRIECAMTSRTGRRYVVVSIGQARFVLQDNVVHLVNRCCHRTVSFRRDSWFECFCGKRFASTGAFSLEASDAVARMSAYYAAFLNPLQADLQAHAAYDAVRTLSTSGVE